MQGYYFQDDWKISPRLTLNLGVRYEYISPYIEKLNQLTVVDPDYPAGRLLIGGTTKAFVPGQGVVDIGVEKYRGAFFVRTATTGRPESGWPAPIGKTVFRSGYGVFYDVQEGNEATFMRFNPPFFFIQNLVADRSCHASARDAISSSFWIAFRRDPAVSVDPRGASRISSNGTRILSANWRRTCCSSRLSRLEGDAPAAAEQLPARIEHPGAGPVSSDAHPERVRYPNFSPNLILVRITEAPQPTTG